MGPGAPRRAAFPRPCGVLCDANAICELFISIEGARCVSLIVSDLVHKQSTEGDAKQVKVTLNQAAVLAEIQRLGEGLIESIEVRSRQ